MHIAELWQYPVKSMIGVRVPDGDLTVDGMTGDRIWATRDEVRGGIRGAKKIGGLMRCSAAPLGDGEVSITLPDGRTTTTTDADVHEKVTEAIGHPVTLWPLQPRTDLDHYRRGAADSEDLLVELRAIFGRTDDEPLPDLSIFPPEIVEFESPPGTYLDAYPLLVMSTSALQSLREALPEAAVDVRRFRPNVVVDTGDVGGHPEFEWLGQRFAVGSAVVEIVAACPRCVMVTRPIDDSLPEDRSVLRHIVRDLAQNVGVYGRVVTPGRVSVGDAWSTT